MDLMGIDRLMNRTLTYLDSRDKEKNGHDERAHVLHTSMSEGRFRCSWPRGHPKGDHQNNRIGQVGKEMEGIGNNRNGTGHQSENHLHAEQ